MMSNAAATQVKTRSAHVTIYVGERGTADAYGVRVDGIPLENSHAEAWRRACSLPEVQQAFPGMDVSRLKGEIVPLDGEENTDPSWQKGKPYKVGG